MSAVVDAISDVVSGVVDFAGDVVETVVDTVGDVVQTVADTAAKVVQSAVDDPIGTIAKIGTAIYAPYLLPAVIAADVVAHGGNFEDAMTAAAVSYVAPEVGSYVGAEVAGTSFGEALKEAANATGIESLPGAVTNGIGRAATSTVAGVARGQDFGDALESGAITGIASVVGKVAGSEADTGSQLADRMIQTSVGAATNAALRGKDVDTAIENAVAMDLLNSAFAGNKNTIKAQLDDWMKSSETVSPRLEEIVKSSIDESTGVKPLMLASADSDTATDAPPGYYVDSDGSMKPIQRIEITGVGEPTSPEDVTQKQYSDEMFNQLVEQFSKPTETTKVDELGNVYDSNGNFIGYASDFNMSMTTDPKTGKTAWQTEEGQVINPTSPIGEVSATTSGTAPSDTGAVISQVIGDQAGDYPVQIINNPDGSVTSVEADGSSYTFNMDGSISYTGPDGETSIVGGPTETTETPTDTSGSTLNNLVQTLIGPTTGTTMPTKSTIGGSFVPAILGGAAIGSALSQDQGSYDPFGIGQYGFSWNPNDINAPVNAVAYGQNYFQPTYQTVNAAGGGLMSIQPAQYIEPTVPGQMSSGVVTVRQDPTSSVQMFAMGGHLGSYSDGGRMLKGPGDGMSDDIPATIAGHQPARLANEEFVIPADVVSHLGNGSSEAGAKVLYKMMADVRKARTGKTKQATQIKPERFMPRR